MVDYYKNDIFGSYQLACECLNDYERTIAFKDSIKRLVGSKTNVLEIGAGTGILSLIAAASGAKHVDAIEIAKPVADIARKNVKTNKFDKKIKIINKDALNLTNADLTTVPDLVVMEMITTGLIEELQIPVFNNLIEKQILKKDSICCPAAFETSATLANVDYNFCGFELKAILHQESWQRNIIKTEHSDKKKYHKVDFNEAINDGIPISISVNENLEFIITRSGTINALLITSEAVLDDSNKIGWTTALNIPIIIPLDDKEVEPGDHIKINIRYQMGKGLENLIIKAD